MQLASRLCVSLTLTENVKRFLTQADDTSAFGNEAIGMCSMQGVVETPSRQVASKAGLRRFRLETSARYHSRCQSHVTANALFCMRLAQIT